MQHTLLNKIQIHPRWIPFLDANIINQLIDIEAQLQADYNPPVTLALRFFMLNPEHIKIIILGQDPYPQPGVATGRAFEVGGLTNWLEKFPQASLRNILRNLYESATGNRKTLTEIRKEIQEGQFHILPPDKLFTHWENQGVLLLNTCFTCETGKPGSHRKIWKHFSNQLIQFISAHYPHTIWFLWGNDARAFKPYIVPSPIYESNHPMMAGKNTPEDFLQCPCFRNTWDMVSWLG